MIGDHWAALEHQAIWGLKDSSEIRENWVALGDRGQMESLENRDHVVTGDCREVEEKMEDQVILDQTVFLVAREIVVCRVSGVTRDLLGQLDKVDNWVSLD